MVLIFLYLLKRADFQRNPNTEPTWNTDAVSIETIEFDKFLVKRSLIYIEFEACHV